MGTSVTYPSQAAGYGATTLMGMAGTLAERAEQALAHSGRDTPIRWLVLHLARAVIAATYAQLATAAAICEHTEARTSAPPWAPPAAEPAGTGARWS